jgi:hypothetical protein
MFERHGITVPAPSEAVALLTTGIGWNLSRRRLVFGGLAGAAAVGGVVSWVVRDETQSFELRGMVEDSEGPLAGAEVSGEGGSSVTGSDGHYLLQLRGPRPEYVRLRFRKTGYNEEPMNVPTEEVFRMVMVKKPVK